MDSEKNGKNGLGVSGGFLGEFYRSSLLFVGIFVAFGEQFCLAFRYVSIGCCLYVVPFLLNPGGLFGVGCCYDPTFQSLLF